MGRMCSYNKNVLKKLPLYMLIGGR